MCNCYVNALICSIEVSNIKIVNHVIQNRNYENDEA
jgi:hypothetical protein